MRPRASIYLFDRIPFGQASDRLRLADQHVLQWEPIMGYTVTELDHSTTKRGGGPSEGEQAPPLPGHTFAPSVARLRPATSEIRLDLIHEPTSGTWLFKEDEIVKGPVAADVIVAKIDDCEIDTQTPLARDMSVWLTIGDIPYFSDRVRIATRNRERAQLLAEHQQKVSVRQRIRLATMAAIIVCPLIMGMFAGWETKKARPWDDHDQWTARVPEYEALKRPFRPAVKKPAGSDSVSPNEDSNMDQLANASTTQKSKKRKKKKRRKSSQLAKASEKSASQKKIESLSNAQVTAGLQKAKGGIGRCLKTEFKRNKNMPGVVTVAFSIANNGKAINVKVKERQVRNTPLPKCLKTVIAKVQWPAFYGERKYVEFPFNIRR